MDTSDFDDMLFGEHEMQAAPNDTEEENSEDEFLFATSQRGNIPWDEAPRYHHQEHTLGPIRDRVWVIARIEAMIDPVRLCLADDLPQPTAKNRLPNRRNAISIFQEQVRKRHGTSTAAAKGLLAGGFRLTRNDGHHINGMSEKEGILVPSVNDNDNLDLTDVQWVLIIEKEATFRSLMSSPRWHTLGSSGIILTAKGYPDLASRKFLSQLAAKAPQIPMYALMDLDPDGVAILSTYKYGSYRLAHEDVTSTDTATPGLPNIRWLGVKSHHMSGTPLGEVHTETSTKSQLQGLMRLTARDRNKAARMLEWNLCAEEGPEKDWRQELQKMLMLNVKAEIQILDEMPGGLVSWLSDRLGQTTELVRVQRMEGEKPDDGMLF
ncbi:uncharacterized protein J4E79_000947 [Alternaria viburni]|uniref:uncharacterized protein n=1 Tax=Alternaria viburni TaxID=566460 RepID=UPI0020C3F40D|nr:uncharacterized protein J4E79_000947 [Alternaria viburni]KAI4668905.1 hypothetical protein J4E79_000947 [Alternaria viburni]